MAHSLSPFLTLWAETCMWVACWRSFCRALAVFLALYWPVSWYLLHSFDTVLENTENHSCIITRGGAIAEKGATGVWWGPPPNCHKTTVTIYLFIQQGEVYHWSHVSCLFGWRNVTILTSQQETRLCNIISSICQNNTHFSSSEPKGKSLQKINALAAGNQDTTRY